MRSRRVAYLEEPKHGEEERDHERHRQVCERMAADHRPDGFEERRQPPLPRCTVEYHSADLRRKITSRRDHES
jgi:hypothetical protein